MGKISAYLLKLDFGLLSILPGFAVVKMKKLALAIRLVFRIKACSIKKFLW